MQQLSSKTKKPLAVIIVIIPGMVVLTALASLGIINPYVQSVLISVGINIIFASSLNIVNGYMGEFSCGHAGFMAVGAYVSSILSLICFNENQFTGSALFPPQFSFLLFPVIVLIGGIAAAIMGLIIAIPSFKTRDDYLAIITLAANYIIVTAINNLAAVGGSRGLMGMKGTLFAMSDIIPIAWMFLWVMIFVAVCIIAKRRLRGSVLGKGISTIRYDEISAEIMSVNTDKMKLLAFMFSSGLAGIGGALFAHQLGFINPASFNIMKSTEGMVMVYLGGMGSLTGSVFAAILFTFLLEAMRPLQILKWVVIPLLLILLMQFRPEGLMGNKELPELINKFKARKYDKGRGDGKAS
jgi:branched-chain amino acid transport system permease protein